MRIGLSVIGLLLASSLAGCLDDGSDPAPGGGSPPTDDEVEPTEPYDTDDLKADLGLTGDSDEPDCANQRGGTSGCLPD